MSAHCFMLRELSISDCPRVTDAALLELARLGPRLRYLSEPSAASSRTGA